MGQGGAGCFAYKQELVSQSAVSVPNQTHTAAPLRRHRSHPERDPHGQGLDQPVPPHVYPSLQPWLNATSSQSPPRFLLGREAHAILCSAPWVSNEFRMMVGDSLHRNRSPRGRGHKRSTCTFDSSKQIPQVGMIATYSASQPCSSMSLTPLPPLSLCSMLPPH